MPVPLPAAWCQASLEGLLFPDTYQVSNADNEAQVVERMISIMERVADQEDLEAGAAERNLTPYQILTIASIIEKEAKLDEDRAKIARVIYNRLFIGMNLQIDATLLYGQPPGSSPSALSADPRAVQHVPQPRSAADADRQPRPRVDSRRRSTRHRTRPLATRCARCSPTRRRGASTCSTCSPTSRAATFSP